jgi:hypothetical protein
MTRTYAMSAFDPKRTSAPMGIFSDLQSFALLRARPRKLTMCEQSCLMSVF